MIYDGVWWSSLQLLYAEPGFKMENHISKPSNDAISKALNYVLWNLPSSAHWQYTIMY